MIPDLDSVSLSQPLIEGDVFVFHCYIRAYDVTYDNGARYTVEFYFDDFVVSGATVVVKAPESKARLTERHVRGHMGKTVSSTHISHNKMIIIYNL